MTITVERAALTEAVNFAARAVPRNSPNPILHGMTLDAEGGMIEAGAFDYDVCARAQADASNGDLSVLVPGHALRFYLGGMSGGTVALRVDGTRLRMECGGVKVSLPLLRREDYPAFPALAEDACEVDGALLAEAIGRIAPVVDESNPLPELTGVQFDAAGSKLTLAGTDRHRFVEAIVPLKGRPRADVHALVPVAVADLLREATGPVGIGWDDSLLSLRSSRESATVRLIGGKFPDYGKALDAHQPAGTATVDRAALVAAAKLSGPGRGKEERKVYLDPSTDSLTLIAPGESDCRAVVEAKIEGDVPRSAWQPRYLLSMAAITDKPELELSFGRANKPVLARGVDDDRSRILVMPIRLSHVEWPADA